MPWMSIIVWLVSYFMSTKSGMSKGKAAMVATGAGLATYYLADPSNSENILGITMGDKTIAGSPSESDGKATSGTASLPRGGGSIVSEVGQTLRSWGPLGTAGVVGVTSGALSNNKWLLWGGAAILAVLLLK